MRFCCDYYVLDDVPEPSCAQTVPYVFLQSVVCRVGGKPEKMLVYGSDILVYGYVIVIYDDKQVAFTYAGIVETFECQSSGQGSVPDQCYRLFSGMSEPGGLCKS